MKFTKKSTKNQVKNNNSINKISNLEQNDDAFYQTIDLTKSMMSYTWRELEAGGKFTKNDKISFITEDMLIVGCDVGSETHYVRAIDFRGIEVSTKAFSFANDAEGFQTALDYMLHLAVSSEKRKIILGLEPTGHYWLCLASWFINNGITVVYKPYAVKQTKEVEDNSQLKDDRKDPKLIANLVKDGNYGIPYIPEDIYADIRELSLLRDQISEDRIRCVNRLHRELKRHFPEYGKALGKIDGKFTTELLKHLPLPCDMVGAGKDGIREIWRNAHLRGRGYGEIDKILDYASNSVGLTEGCEAGRIAIKWFAEQISKLNEEIGSLESKLNALCMSLPNTGELTAISGIGNNTITGILSQLGDISRFDDVKEIQKLSGLGLVSSNSGKHNGETKISRRGRKRLRCWLFQAAKSAVHHADEFKQLHIYYTTRPINPLKKMQSLIAVACKILRVMFAILKTGNRYDPQKMLRDIKRTPIKETLAMVA